MINNIEYIEPYKILKISTTSAALEENGAALTVDLIFEIPPGQMNRENTWVDASPDEFDDVDVKDAIVSAHSTVWTSEVKEAYKSHFLETYAPVQTSINNPISYDQIESVLNDLIAADKSE